MHLIGDEAFVHATSLGKSRPGSGAVVDDGAIEGTWLGTLRETDTDVRDRESRASTVNKKQKVPHLRADPQT